MAAIPLGQTMEPPPTDPPQRQQQSGTQFEEGKIFVGGLSSVTTVETLKKYFEKFGEITEVQIMEDPVTERSRGFGFITFKDPRSVEAVLSNKPHRIDDKIVDPKPAVVKGVPVGPTGLLVHARKIFIGGVAQGTSDEDIKEYFKQYGSVVDVDLKHDRDTKRMRGFGFVGFVEDESASKAVGKRYHTINGKTIEVKPAEPRGKTPSGIGRGGYATAAQCVYPPPPQQGVYQDYTNPAAYNNYRPGNGYNSYTPSGYPPYPPQYPQYPAYPPPNGAAYPPPSGAAYPQYGSQYSGQDYSYNNYGQSSYTQENGYNHRAGGYANADAYSSGASYNSYAERNSQFPGYGDATPGTANYGRGTSQQRFPGYNSH